MPKGWSWDPTLFAGSAAFYRAWPLALSSRTTSGDGDGTSTEWSATPARCRMWPRHRGSSRRASVPAMSSASTPMSGWSRKRRDSQVSAAYVTHVGDACAPKTCRPGLVGFT
jgi:hypothetical protein